MPEKSLHELFIEELRDAYDAEKRLTKALPKLAKAAESPELADAFTTHLRETEGQIEMLEQVFALMDERPRGKKCDGMIGIIEEGNSAIEELDEGPVRDAALIAGAQRAEHYEIAAYGTLAYFAEIMGHGEAKELLGEILEQEKAADEKLNKLAKSKVNREALMEHSGMGDQDEEEEESGMEMAVANERAPRARSGGSSRSRSGGSSRRSSSSGGRGRSAKKR